MTSHPKAQPRAEVGQEDNWVPPQGRQALQSWAWVPWSREGPASDFLGHSLLNQIFLRLHCPKSPDSVSPKPSGEGWGREDTGIAGLQEK